MRKKLYGKAFRVRGELLRLYGKVFHLHGEVFHVDFFPIALRLESLARRKRRDTQKKFMKNLC